jgi:DNA-binding GntR family transcriptional regulator
MTRLSEMPTLVPWIVESVRDMILRDELRAGKPIPQLELAKTLGVSTIPLREALRRLEAEGLITFLPYKGVLVTPVTVEEVEEIQDLSMCLEELLLARALPRLTDEDFQALESLSDRLDQGLLAAEGAEGVVAFYRILFVPAERPLILQVVESAIRRSVRFFPAIQGVREHLRDARPTRKELVAACRSRDLARATATLLEFNRIRAEALLVALRRAEAS